MKRDLSSNVKVAKALTAQAVTGTDTSVNGDGIEVGPEIAAMFTAVMGPSGDALGPALRADFRLEESDDDISYSAVADEDLTGTPVVVAGKTGVIASIDDAAEDDAAVKGGYRGSKKYCRMVVDLVGAHASGFAVAATAILKPTEMPQPLG